jgi:hypothetical protein
MRRFVSLEGLAHHSSPRTPSFWQKGWHSARSSHCGIVESHHRFWWQPNHWPRAEAEGARRVARRLLNGLHETERRAWGDSAHPDSAPHRIADRTTTSRRRGGRFAPGGGRPLVTRLGTRPETRMNCTSDFGDQNVWFERQFSARWRASIKYGTPWTCPANGMQRSPLRDFAREDMAIP